MNVQALLDQALGGDAIGQMSRQIGADEQMTATAVQAALPLLIGGLARNSENPEGAASLSAALGRDHDGNILDDLGGFLGQGGASQGAGILGHIFGGRQQTVEAGVSRASGLDTGSAAQLLMMLAPVVMGALGRAQRQQGLDPGALAGMLGQERQQLESNSGFGMLSQLLDSNNDGQVLDDIARLAGGFLGGRR